MRFGEIIKKAWHITWRYRYLWILGLFAGVTGGSGGVGGGGNGFSRFNTGTGTGSSTPANPFNADVLRTFLQQWLPAIVVGVALLTVIGIAFAIVGIGARGGLIWAVNEIEEGRRPRLGQAWDAGFAKFWSLLGFGIMVQLPIVIAAFAMAAAILLPILTPLLRGRTPDPAGVIVPMCGALAIGIPVLLVAGLVLGVMYITGTRFIVLNGASAGHAVGESWRALRARFADHALMYLINVGLSIAASLVIAVPLIVLTLMVAVPVAVAGASSHWGFLAVVVGVAFLVVMVVAFAYSAIWGTFTSSLWTIFFRRLTGREPLWPDASPIPVAPAGAPMAPAVPGYGPVGPAQWGVPETPAAPPAAPGPPAPPAPPADQQPPAAPPMYAPPQPSAQPQPPAQLQPSAPAPATPQPPAPAQPPAVPAIPEEPPPYAQ